MALSGTMSSEFPSTMLESTEMLPVLLQSGLITATPEETGGGGGGGGGGVREVTGHISSILFPEEMCHIHPCKLTNIVSRNYYPRRCVGLQEELLPQVF